MRKNKLSEEESLMLKELRESDNLKREIHEMLKKLIIKTEIGEIEEGWADDLNFDIGDFSIYSCGYYQQLTLVDKDGIEHELDNDLKNVKKLFKEIKKRADEFNKIIQNKSLKIAVKVFKKPFQLDLSGEN